MVLFKIKKKWEWLKLYTLNLWFFQKCIILNKGVLIWEHSDVCPRPDMANDEVQKSVTWGPVGILHWRWNWVQRLRQTISETSRDLQCSSFLEGFKDEKAKIISLDYIRTRLRGLDRIKLDLGIKRLDWITLELG